MASVTGMAGMLQQQLDEVRTLLQRARELFGQNPVAPPDTVPPAPREGSAA